MLNNVETHVCTQPFDDVKKGMKVLVNPFFTTKCQKGYHVGLNQRGTLSLPPDIFHSSLTGGVVEDVNNESGYIGIVFDRGQCWSYLRDMLLVEGVDFNPEESESSGTYL